MNNSDLKRCKCGDTYKIDNKSIHKQSKDHVHFKTGYTNLQLTQEIMMNSYTALKHSQDNREQLNTVIEAFRISVVDFKETLECLKDSINSLSINISDSNTVRVVKQRMRMSIPEFEGVGMNTIEVEY